MKYVIIIAIAVVFGLGVGLSINVSAEEGLIPSWIKTTAGFWVDGQIGDSEFLSALQFLVKDGILVIPQGEQDKSTIVESKIITEVEFPRIIERLEGQEAVNKFYELENFHMDTSWDKKYELAERKVSESEFAFMVSFESDWTGSYEEGTKNQGYPMYNDISGKGITIIPFDCSHNKDYAFLITANKKQETGIISIYSFKNGVWISYNQDVKPWGNTFNTVECDYPLIVEGVNDQGTAQYDNDVQMKQYFP
jgi:hypothetical protein